MVCRVAIMMILLSALTFDFQYIVLCLYGDHGDSLMPWPLVSLCIVKMFKTKYIKRELVITKSLMQSVCCPLEVKCLQRMFAVDNGHK